MSNCFDHLITNFIPLNGYTGNRLKRLAPLKDVLDLAISVLITGIFRSDRDDDTLKKNSQQVLPDLARVTS